MMVLIEHHNVRETYKWLHCQYPNRPLQFSIAVSHSKLTRMARAILSFAIFIATQIELSIINNNDKKTKICIHIVENGLPDSYFLELI